MSALNHIAVARSDIFSSRVLMLSFTAAQNVAAEDAGTANHAERVKYSNHILIGSENAKILATHVIASNPTIQAAIDSDPAQSGNNVPDGDIAYALASIWDARSIAYAGGATR